MTSKIETILKNNSVLQEIYKVAFSFIFRILGLFIKIDDRLILFNSFGGKKFDDSPKVIFEYMKNDKRFKGYKFIWAFHNPENFEVDGAKKIKTDTLQYFIYALKARVWITNSSMERGLNFKKKRTFCLNTWHGTPIKKMGIDINKKELSNIKYNYDKFNAQGEYDIKIFSKAFNLSFEKFLLCGLPRNDELADSINNPNLQAEKKSKLNIPINKKVILYAPTFRDYIKDEKRRHVISVPINLEKWKAELGDNFVLLIRAHYEVMKTLGIEFDNNFVFDVSNYPILNDLLIASDYLISDYSSIIFDYSILGRPIYCFTYDEEQYYSKRGTYIKLDKELPNSVFKNEDQLLYAIKNQDYNQASKNTIKFREKYVQFYGNATKMTVDTIFKELSSNEFIKK